MNVDIEDIKKLLFARVVQPYAVCCALVERLSAEAVSKYYIPASQKTLNKYIETETNEYIDNEANEDIGDDSNQVDFMKAARQLIDKMKSPGTEVAVSQLKDGTLLCTHTMPEKDPYQCLLPISPYANDIRDIAFEFLGGFYEEDIKEEFTSKFNIEYKRWVNSWSGAKKIENIATRKYPVLEENSEVLVQIFQLNSVDALGEGIIHFVEHINSDLTRETSIIASESDYKIKILPVGVDPNRIDRISSHSLSPEKSEIILFVQ